MSGRISESRPLEVFFVGFRSPLQHPRVGIEKRGIGLARREAKKIVECIIVLTFLEHVT
jgi:hypothetical protein